MKDPELNEVQGLEGKRATKKSGKPFKSGLKVNTIKGVVNHPMFRHLILRKMTA